MKINELPNILTSKANQFNKKGISTVEDLLNYLPRKYNDFSTITSILPPDQVSALVLQISDYRTYRKNAFVLKAFCSDTATGTRITINWFNQTWMVNQVSSYVGHKVLVCGKVEYDSNYNSYSITNPVHFTGNITDGLGIFPVFSKISGMTDAYIASTLQKALETPCAYVDNCPDDIVSREGQIPMREAYRYIYFPKTMAEVEKGKSRILFNDLLYFALHNEWAAREHSVGSSMNIKTLALVNKIINDLPFELTVDQRMAVDTICQIGKSGKRINALVQGDVSCGKTLVAQLSMAAFAGSGYQAAMMAPTQVLAEQHYESTKELFEPYGIKVCFISGLMTAAQKKAAYAQIKSGEVQIIIGTTSILNKAITYKNLAICIADEEQRFGVSQRGELLAKAKDGVHSITMSATPIPRSLAMSMYGDAVELITIQSMPSGRQPIATGIAKSREAIYRYILKEKKLGHQTYVVCPLIEKNDTEAKSVEEISKEYSAALTPFGITIETLTGRNSAKETTEIIKRFKDGLTDILVSTTVIEVGVNVPNATSMIICNAERFGLATLHQLRGRVGRGKFKSICVLESSATDGKALERLQAMCDTSNGFEIAKKDLEIRGAGDFIGTQQSGKDNKYISLMLAYPDEYKHAKTIASELLDRGYDCCPLTQRVYEEVSVSQ